MKLFVTALLLLATPAIVFCQALTDEEQKVIDVYGQNSFNEMKSNNPGLLAILKGYAIHGFKIEQNSHPKFKKVSALAEIPLRSKSTQSISVEDFLTAYNGTDFNILEYKFFPKQHTQVFRLQGTDYILVIDRQESILSK